MKKAEGTTTKKAKTTKSSSACSCESTVSNVTFEYFAPEAKQVYLAGTFNNWNTGTTALRKEKSGRWQIEMALQPGKYEYRYLVDGSWQNDQRPVGCVKNSFGGSNCVLEVPKTTI